MSRPFSCRGHSETLANLATLNVSGYVKAAPDRCGAKQPEGAHHGIGLTDTRSPSWGGLASMEAAVNARVDWANRFAPILPRLLPRMTLSGRHSMVRKVQRGVA